MYSWANPGSSVFCDWLFLVFVGVSLEIAANFPLFLNVAMILREKFCQLRKLDCFLIYNKSVDLFYHHGKSFNKGKQLMISKN